VLEKNYFVKAIFLFFFAVKIANSHYFDSPDVQSLKDLEKETTPEQYFSRRKKFFDELNYKLSLTNDPTSFIDLLKDNTYYTKGLISSRKTLISERCLMFKVLHGKVEHFNSMNPNGNEWSQFFNFFLEALYGPYAIEVEKKETRHFFKKVLVSSARVGAGFVFRDGDAVLQGAMVWFSDSPWKNAPPPQDAFNHFDYLFKKIIFSNIAEADKLKFLNDKLPLNDIFEGVRYYFIESYISKIIEGKNDFSMLFLLKVTESQLEKIKSINLFPKHSNVSRKLEHRAHLLRGGCRAKEVARPKVLGQTGCRSNA